MIRGKKKDAEKYLTAKLRDKDLGINIEPASKSLGKYLDKWLESSVKRRVRNRTFEDYTALLERYVREPLGALRLSDLRPAHIQQLYRSMQDRGLSPRVVRYTHAVLSSVLKQARMVRFERLLSAPIFLVSVGILISWTLSVC